MGRFLGLLFSGRLAKFRKRGLALSRACCGPNADLRSKRRKTRLKSNPDILIPLISDAAPFPCRDPPQLRRAIEASADDGRVGLRVPNVRRRCGGNPKLREATER